MVDIARAIDARGEADEGREHNKDDVEVVDEEIAAAFGLDDEKHKREEKRRAGGAEIDDRRASVGRFKRDRNGRGGGNAN